MEAIDLGELIDVAIFDEPPIPEDVRRQLDGRHIKGSRFRKYCAWLSLIKIVVSINTESVKPFP
jgi:hypothetical protein